MRGHGSLQLPRTHAYEHPTQSRCLNLNTPAAILTFKSFPITAVMEVFKRLNKVYVLVCKEKRRIYKTFCDKIVQPAAVKEYL